MSLKTSFEEAVSVVAEAGNTVSPDTPPEEERYGNIGDASVIVNTVHAPKIIVSAPGENPSVLTLIEMHAGQWLNVRTTVRFMGWQAAVSAAAQKKGGQLSLRPVQTVTPIPGGERFHPVPRWVAKPLAILAFTGATKAARASMRIAA